MEALRKMNFRAGIIVLTLGAILALGVGLRSCATEGDAESGGGTSTWERDRSAGASNGSDHVEARPSKLPRPAPEESANHFIRKKLKSIIIPVIAFDDTSLEEAIDFLRARSIELDQEEADPARKGISFVIRKPREDAATTAVDPLRMPEDAREIRLSMEARDISLWDALHRIASEAGLKVEITDHGIELLSP